MKKYIIILCFIGTLILTGINVLGNPKEINDFIKNLSDNGIKRILVYPRNQEKTMESILSIPIPSIFSAKKDKHKILITTDQYYNECNSFVYVEPDYVRMAIDGDGETTLQSDWAYERTGVNTLKEKFKDKTEEIIIAVVDSGIDEENELFQDRLVEGYDFIDNDDDPFDELGHGTKVAGVIVNSTPSNIKIMPIRSLNEEGEGYDYKIAKGVYYAVEQGADVINLSLVGLGYSGFLDMAINYALNENVMVIAGAGNDSMDTRYFYPAGKEEIIVVSSINSRDDISLFSNFGASIDIAAPGEDIDSMLDGEELDSGTSFATPFVSAIAGMLLLDHEIRTVEAIENSIMFFCDDVGLQGWDKAFGHGVLNFQEYIANYKMTNYAFKIISKNRKIPSETDLYVKYFSPYIGKKLIINIDGEQYYEQNIEYTGYYYSYVDIKDLKGKHKVDIYIVGTHSKKKVDTYEIEILDYNTSFEVYDGDYWLTTDYTMKLYGGRINESISVDEIEYTGGIFRDGRYYVNIDMEKVLSEYDYVLAICEPTITDGIISFIPIYSKKIVSTGQKVFYPENIQSVVLDDGTYDVNVLLGVYNGESSTSKELEYMTLIGEQELLLDAGPHKVLVSSDKEKFAYTLNNDYYTWLDKDELKEVTIHTGELMKFNDKIEVIGGAYLMDYIPINFGHYRYYDDQDVLSITPNRYMYEFYLEDYNKELRAFRYIDLIAKDKDQVTFGTSLTNQFLVNYLSGTLNVIVFVKDEYGNHYTPSKDIWNDSMLMMENVDTGYVYSAYISDYIAADNLYQGIDPFEVYTFSSNDNIPDGSYRLRLKFMYSASILPTNFTEMEVQVKDGQFYHEEENAFPRLMKQKTLYKIDLHETFELNLSEVFSDKDDLMYQVNQGYILDNTYYLEGNLSGIHNIQISASDFKRGSIDYIFNVVVVDDGIIFDDYLEDDTEEINDDKVNDNKVDNDKEDDPVRETFIKDNPNNQSPALQEKKILTYEEQADRIFNRVVLGLSIIILVTVAILIIYYISRKNKTN